MRKGDLVRALRSEGCSRVLCVNTFGRWAPRITCEVDGVPVALCVDGVCEVVSVNGRDACGAWRFRGSADTVARAIVKAVKERQGYHLAPIDGVSGAPCEDAFEELLGALPGEGVFTHDRASGARVLRVDGYVVASCDDDASVVCVGGFVMPAGAALAWIKG